MFERPAPQAHRRAHRARSAAKLASSACAAGVERQRRPWNRRRRGRRGCGAGRPSPRGSPPSAGCRPARRRGSCAPRARPAARPWCSGASSSVEGGRLGRRCRPAWRSPPRDSSWIALLERAPLVAAVGVGAVEVVDLADAAAGELLDLAAQLDERAARGRRRACWPSVDLPAPRRPISAMRRLRAGSPAPVPNSSAERDARAAQLGVARCRAAARGSAATRASCVGHVADQLGERAVERRRDLLQHQDRGVADAVFEVGQVALGHVRGRARPPCASGRGARAACARARRGRARNGILAVASGRAIVTRCTGIVLDSVQAHRRMHIVHACRVKRRDQPRARCTMPPSRAERFNFAAAPVRGQRGARRARPPTSTTAARSSYGELDDRVAPLRRRAARRSACGAKSACCC